MPRDGGFEIDNEDGQDASTPEEEGPGDAVLVLDADSPTAEQVVLQLILARYGVSCLLRPQLSVLLLLPAFPFHVVQHCRRRCMSFHVASQERLTLAAGPT